MYNVPSGDIQAGVLYLVAGEQSVIYDIYLTMPPGSTFRGVPGVKDFYFDGSGTALVYEVLELKGGGIEFEPSPIDQPLFDELTDLLGMSIEFELTEAEKIVIETTEIKGMTLELVDYPLYSFQITERRG